MFVEVFSFMRSVRGRRATIQLLQGYVQDIRCSTRDDSSIRHYCRAFGSSSTATAMAKRGASTGDDGECHNHNWETIIGVELHVQLATHSKLFSHAPSTHHTQHLSSSSSIIDHPNTHVSPFDASLPGILPVLNTHAVEMGILASSALNCRINCVDVIGNGYQSGIGWDRKHYSYADLPHGYQVTQQRVPLAEDGYIDIALDESTSQLSKLNVDDNTFQTRRIRIQRAHLEMDTGKTTAVDDQARASESNDGSIKIDLNRAGCALLEVRLRWD